MAAMSETVGVSLEQVTKTFGSTVAAKDISLQIQSGEIVSLLGPSGCGKTTLLRIVAGLVTPDRGDVKIGGKSVIGLPPHRSEAGIVFQSYALFPHLTVARNVAFGLEVRRYPARETREIVERMLALVGLSDLGQRRPSQLSGGQQQRVALARVLAIKPKVLLLDEPFGALDRKLREEMQVEVTRIVREMQVTTIFVTHDQEEALVLSDRIAVMDRGQLVQVAPGLEIYRQPANAFVADFVGHANFLSGRVAFVDPTRCVVRTEAGLEIERRPSSALERGKQVQVLVRPENLRLEAPSGQPGMTEGTVAFGVHFGAHSEYQLETLSGLRLKARSSVSTHRIGDRLAIGVADPAACIVFVDGARLDK